MNGLGTPEHWGIIALKYLGRLKSGSAITAEEIQDEDKHPEFRKMSIHQAFNKLRNGDYEIARSINVIDNCNKERLKEEGIEEKRWIKARIEDRLTLTRNTMLHGENHGMHDEGPFLIMLYILFHLHDWQSK